MGDRKLATIHIEPPIADDDVWTVSIDPEDPATDGAWFEHQTAAEAFAHAAKWISDRGLRMNCQIDVFAALDPHPDTNKETT